MTYKNAVFDLLEEAEESVGIGFCVVRGTVGIGRAVQRIHDLGDFNQHIVLIILIKGVDCLFVHIADHVHRCQVHVLDGLHHVGQFALGGLEHLQHVVEVGAGDDGDVAALGLNGAEQGALSDDSQRPLRADEQVFQVGSRVVLAQRGHVVQHGAVRQDCRQSDAVGVERVMPNELDTARVGGQITPDEAGALGTQVERHFIAAHLGVVLHIAQYATSLGTDNPVGLIEAQNAVHALRVEDDLVVNWHRATDEPRAATLGHDCQFALIAVGKNGADIGRILRLEHHRRASLVFLSPICVVNIKLLFVGDHSLVANHPLKELHILRLELAVQWVPVGLSRLHKLFLG